MTHLIAKFRSRAAARRTGESGLALLDVLLGMAIFALIAVIAVQSMGQFRARAYQTATASDAQQLAVGLESYLTDNAAYPALVDIDTAAEMRAVLGVNLTTNNSMSRYTVAGTGYSFCVVNSAGAWSEYQSTAGAIVRSGSSAPVAGNVATGGNCV